MPACIQACLLSYPHIQVLQKAKLHGSFQGSIVYMQLKALQSSNDNNSNNGGMAGGTVQKVQPP